MRSPSLARSCWSRASARRARLAACASGGRAADGDDARDAAAARGAHRLHARRRGAHDHAGGPSRRQRPAAVDHQAPPGAAAARDAAGGRARAGPAAHLRAGADAEGGERVARRQAARRLRPAAAAARQFRPAATRCVSSRPTAFRRRSRSPTASRRAGVAVRLRWKPARLTVKRDPESADVLVDGSILRSGQPLDVVIPDAVRRHDRASTVKVSAPGFATKSCRSSCAPTTSTCRRVDASSPRREERRDEERADRCCSVVAALALASTALADPVAQSAATRSTRGASPTTAATTARRHRHHSTPCSTRRSQLGTEDEVVVGAPAARRCRTSSSTSRTEARSRRSTSLLALRPELPARSRSSIRRSPCASSTTSAIGSRSASTCSASARSRSGARAQSAERRLAEARAKAEHIYVDRVVETHSRSSRFLPFGAGQCAERADARRRSRSASPRASVRARASDLVSTWRCNIGYPVNPATGHQQLPACGPAHRRPRSVRLCSWPPAPPSGRRWSGASSTRRSLFKREVVARHARTRRRARRRARPTLFDHRRPDRRRRRRARMGAF